MWLILSLRGRFLFLMGVYLISYYMKKYVVCWYAALDADLIGGLVGRYWLQLGTCSDVRPHRTDYSRTINR